MEVTGSLFCTVVGTGPAHGMEVMTRVVIGLEGLVGITCMNSLRDKYQKDGMKVICLAKSMAAIA